MLPAMVLTPKTWYRDIESHSTQLEQLLQTAYAHSLPTAPFLVVTNQAFDAFCLMHKLSALDREHAFPLKESARTKLMTACKRLSLPEALVDSLTKHYLPILGKHDVFLWSGIKGLKLREHQREFVGEVSALSALRNAWAQLISELGLTRSRVLLLKHPLYLFAQPKHSFTGELRLKDKLLAECVIKINGEESQHSLFIDLTSGEVSSNPNALDLVPTRLPLNQTALGSLARALYRKSLFKDVCPIAGTKSTLWIQPREEISFDTVTTQKPHDNRPVVLAKGESKSKGIAVGQAIIIKHERDWRKVHAHHIVVTNLSITKTSQISLKMRALVSERANIGALVANHMRELRFPVVAGVVYITKLVKNGQVISVDASKGTIYTGNSFAQHKVTENLLPSVTSKPTTSTVSLKKSKPSVPRIPLIDNPRQLSTSSDQREHKRVLLSWGNSIIKELGVHPKRLWLDKQSSKITQFIEKSLITFKHEAPDTILMYALSDFDLPTLSRLKFSPVIQKSRSQSYFGLRGIANLLVDASDFTHMEIAALAKAHAKRIRIDVVVPFCRTAQELIALKRLLASYHLVRGGYFKVFMRLETPLQLAQLDAFIDAGIDGLVLDMHRLSLLYSGIHVGLADHAPLKHDVYQELSAYINHCLMGLSVKLPVFAWYNDYDIAYASDLWPKRINGFIA